MRSRKNLMVTGLILTAGVIVGATQLYALPPVPGDLNSNGIHDFDDVAILVAILDGAPSRWPISSARNLERP